MDPTGQYGAASYTAVPDLDARLLAMRLGDPSSARQQARYPALTPLLLPRDLATTATPSVQPLLRLPPSPPQEFVTIADPSVSLRQARYPEPTPLLLPRDLVPTATPVRPRLFLPPIPPREFVTTATSVERPPPENQPKPQVFVPTDSTDVCWLQQLQVARQYWAQSQPQLLSCGAGESSVGTGCVSPLGPGSIFASLYGKHSQHLNALAAAAPFLPKVPKPSKLSPSAEDFQPVPKPSKLNPSAEDFHPAPKPSKLSPSAEGIHAIPQSHHLMAQSSWTPSSSAGQCLHQLGAAGTSSAGLDNGSLDPYMSALLTAPLAKQDRSWDRAPASGRLPCLNVVLAQLLCASRKPASVTSDELAKRVVCLLAEGGEEVRLKVLDAVKRAVHTIMGCREGHVVFLALLRACEGRFDELHGIVNAACTGDGSLMRATKEFYGYVR
jgi:pumilio RNA-binding family